jgi:predicted MFS family arabinose efflux permease
MWRSVAANRDLMRLEIVWACVSLVRWALAILVALYAYQEAGVAGVGVSALVRMVPAALLASRLSLLADLRSRRRVLLVSLALRAVVGVGMALVVFADASLATLLVLAAAYGVAESLQKPAQAALLGVHARNPTELAAANTLWSMMDNAAFVIGSVLVGAVVTLAGLGAAFAVCVLPLVTGTLFAWRLTPDSPPPPLPDTGRKEQALAGLLTMTRDRRLRLLMTILAVVMFVQAMVDVLLVVVAIGILGMGEQGAGWLSAAWGVGGVAGGAAAVVLLARGHLSWGITIGLVLTGLPFAAIAVWQHQGAALALMIVLGVGFGLLEVALLTLTQRQVPADVLGRVYGVEETLVTVAMAAGSLAASRLVAAVGEPGALALTGAVLPALAVLVLPSVRRLDQGSGAAEWAFELLRAVPAFAVLPVATVENLALRARQEEFATGTDVVTQGDEGKTFYVIAHGSLEVIENGVSKRVQSEGECFGEIALLHGVRRTATVRAKVPSTLLALDQAEFLAAVGAHPRTAYVLHEVAADWLVAPRTDVE